MLESFRERKAKVSHDLHVLGTLAGSVGARSLAARVESALVQKLDEDRFHLVVVGEFNHGKSTFINALLGTRALPTGVTPTTAAIHHIRYAEQPEAALVYASGERKPIPFESARDFSVGGTTVESIDYLEVGYPSPLLAERILLVDTPGVNDLSLQRSDITYSYIPRADAVLFLLDAGQILKESERVFLQEKLLKGSRDKIIFVITKWDLLDKAEQQEAFDYARTHLSAFVTSPVIFPVSAEHALDGRRSESGLDALLAHLTTFLAEERGRILLDNALGEGLNVTLLLQRGIDARRRAVTMASDELDRRIATLEADLKGQASTIEQRRLQIREELAGIKVGARKDLERFVDETIAKLPGVIDSAKTDELKQHLPAFLEDAFRKWAEAETKEIAEQLERLAERTVALVRDDARATTDRVGEVLGSQANKPLNVEVDTFAYDVGVVALMVGGLGFMVVNVVVGGLLAVAGPVLALMLKSRVEDEFRKRAKEVAPGVLRDTAAKIGPQLDQLIEEFGNKLDEWVVSAGEELHRQVLEVLQQSRDGRSAGVVDEAQALVTIDAQEEELLACRGTLEAARKGLWLTSPTPQSSLAQGPAATGTETKNVSNL